MRYLMFSPERKAMTGDEVLALAAETCRLPKGATPEEAILLMEESEDSSVEFDTRFHAPGAGANPCGVPR